MAFQMMRFLLYIWPSNSLWILCNPKTAACARSCLTVMDDANILSRLQGQKYSLIVCSSSGDLVYSTVGTDFPLAPISLPYYCNFVTIAMTEKSVHVGNQRTTGLSEILRWRLRAALVVWIWIDWEQVLSVSISLRPSVSFSGLIAGEDCLI